VNKGNFYDPSIQILNINFIPHDGPLFIKINYFIWKALSVYILRPSSNIMVECSACGRALDNSNPANIRCTNIDCEESQNCHCCDVPLGSVIAKLVCYVCKEPHCIDCEKDDFTIFDDLSESIRHYCEDCKTEVFPDDSWWPETDLETELEVEYPEDCQMNDCLGLLDYEGDHATCLECDMKWNIEQLHPDYDWDAEL